MICWHCEKQIRKMRYLKYHDACLFKGGCMLLCSKCKNLYDGVMDLKRYQNAPKQ